MIYQAARDGSVWRIDLMQGGFGTVEGVRLSGGPDDGARCIRHTAKTEGVARARVIAEIETVDFRLAADVEQGEGDDAEPVPPPVWEQDLVVCEDGMVWVGGKIAFRGNKDLDAAVIALIEAVPEMKRAGDALEALLTDDYWQSDRLRLARDAWRAASRKAEGGGR